MYEDFWRQTGYKPLNLLKTTPRNVRGSVKVGWEHSVRFSDTIGVGAQLREVQATVRSLPGFTTTRTIPLGTRVEPGGMTPIRIEASLVTSNPDDPGNLQGIEEAIFSGQDDRGQPVRVVVRIPLE